MTQVQRFFCSVCLAWVMCVGIAFAGELRSEFLSAIESQDWDQVRKLLNAQEDPNGTSSDGTPALILVLEADKEGKSLGVIQEFLKRGARVNGVDAQGTTPLFVAASLGRKDVVEVLLGAGADIQAKNEWNSTALVAALGANAPDIAIRLLALGARTDVVDLDGYSPAFYAAQNNLHGLLATLLQKASNSTQRSQYWNDVLLGASGGGHSTLVRQALASKANLNAAGTNGVTPLLLAASSGRADIVQILLAAGSDKNRRSANGMGLFLAAAIGGLNDVLQQLIAEGKNPGSFAQEAPLAVQMAASGNHGAAVETLMRLNPRLDRQVSGVNSPLASAVKYQNAQWVRWFLDAGANPNEQGAVPVLAGAIVNKNVEILDLLLKAGADVNMPIRVGGLSEQKPLSLAISTKDITVVRRLLQSKPELQPRGGQQQPLEQAVSDQFEEAVRALIVAGADIGARSASGSTALHEAARVGALHPQPGYMMQVLLSYRPNPNVLDSNGKTPLMVASTTGNLEAARYLVSAGADTGLRSPDGKTAFDMAREGQARATGSRRFNLKAIETLLAGAVR